MINIQNVMIATNSSLYENSMKSIEENSSSFSEMFLHLDILNLWSKTLESFEQTVILKEVCYDLLSSVYIASQGMYRNGFISLRSALELGLSFVYFIDRNYEYLLWKINDYDMKWSTLKDENGGVLSKRYFSLFLGDYEPNQLISNIIDAYRECSEYVHGKYSYMHTVEHEKILYKKDKFQSWSNMFVEITKILNIILSIRFPEVANMFADDKKITLKDTLVDYKLGELIN